MRRMMNDTLLSWKKAEKKRPLVLPGTRQTGKIWLLQDLGQRYFRHQDYFHLETDQALHRYFAQEQEPAHLLETYSHTPVLPGQTLVILDGQQACPAAREALAGFAAEFPEYAITGIQRLPGPIPFPPIVPADAQVGELEGMVFEEFLWACREAFLSKEIREQFQNRAPLGKRATSRRCICSGPT